MSSVDPQRVREWKASYEAVNRIAIEEALERSPSERLRQHQVFLERLAAMGRLPVRKPDDKFYLRWDQVRKRWL